MRNVLHRLPRVAAGALLFAAGVCAAQQFTSKPIRIVVPLPACNSFDVTARILAQGLIVAPGSSEQFAALLKSDGARYSRIAREANVRLD